MSPSQQPNKPLVFVGDRIFETTTGNWVGTVRLIDSITYDANGKESWYCEMKEDETAWVFFDELLDGTFYIEGLPLPQKVRRTNVSPFFKGQRIFEDRLYLGVVIEAYRASVGYNNWVARTSLNGVVTSIGLYKNRVSIGKRHHGT